MTDKNKNLGDKLISFLKEQHLIARAQRIILAVSGGLDSVTMLALFFEIKDELGIELAVLHLNHGLRGEESDDDQAFVKELAEQYKLPFFSKTVDTLTFKKKNKLSLEDAARKLRYKFFEETLSNVDADSLATAHTADDQAETVIDHFLRGSGMLGLAGMKTRRDCYIRPMLCFFRIELETYSSQKKLVYREDSSNRDLNFKRNRIRYELIPYLKKNFNSNIGATLNRSANIFRDTENHLKAVAKEACKSLVSLQKKSEIYLEIEGFLDYNIQIRNYILFACFELLRIDRDKLDYGKLYKINKLIEKRDIGKKFPIDTTFHLWVDREVVVISEREIRQLKKIEVNLKLKKSTRYQDCQFNWSLVETETDIVFDTNKNIEYFDYDKIGTKLSIRSTYPGDYFIPLNLNGKKKISDFFTDNKVPLRDRRNVAILESGDQVVWVCGHQIDDRFKVNSKTKKILKMEMKG